MMYWALGWTMFGLAIRCGIATGISVALFISLVVWQTKLRKQLEEERGQHYKYVPLRIYVRGEISESTLHSLQNDITGLFAKHDLSGKIRNRRLDCVQMYEKEWGADWTTIGRKNDGNTSTQ